MYLPTFLLFAIISATVVPAAKIDEVLARQEKRQVSLSTGGSVASDSSTPVTDDSSQPGSTTTFTQSSQVTSQGSVIIESSTVVASPTVAPTTLIVESTITRTSTNAQGQTTAVQETISSVATSSVAISYSEYVTSSVSQILETSVYTEGGNTITATRTSSTVVPVTTRAAVTGMASSSGSGGSSGLSDSSKKIIGGVVGGIGGALVLGALAYTAWRIWGKKKNLHDDDLYDPNANSEKFSSSTDQNQNSPFKSTLDQYHNPGPVNTASNF